MKKLAFLGVLALAAALPAIGSPAAKNPTVFFDCPGAGKPQVKPTDIILACGDGNSSIGDLSWTGWGSSFTAGRGTLSVNDCKPNCAAGHDHFFPVVVILSGTQVCHPGGQIAYLKLTAAYLDNRSHISFSQNFICKPS